jgi:hypothetical protein
MFWSAKPRPWRFFAENAAITKYGAGEDVWKEANRKCMLSVQLGCSNIENLRIFKRKSRVHQFDHIFFYKLYWGYQGTAVKFYLISKDFKKIKINHLKKAEGKFF